jgi:hypothetical protein
MSEKVFKVLAIVVGLFVALFILMIVALDQW